MPKPLEIPKKVDDWKAPWEVDADGKDIPAEDQKPDLTSIKGKLHAAYLDNNGLRAQVDEVRADRDQLQEAVAKADDPAKLKKLQDENKKLIEERDAAQSGAGLEATRLRIALRKGLTERQAARLVGKDEKELEADADELLEEFGGKQQQSTDDEGAGGGPNPRSRPQVLRTAGDPDPDAGKNETREPDYNAIVAKQLSLSRIG